MRIRRILVCTPGKALVAATLCKAVVVLLCYQHVIDDTSDSPGIANGYGWDELLRVTAAKLRVFIPYRYYPLEGSPLKDVLFVVPYSLALAAFLWALARGRHFTDGHAVLLVTLAASILPGLLFFMLSRHLYSIIVLMTLFAFASWRPPDEAPSQARRH